MILQRNQQQFGYLYKIEKVLFKSNYLIRKIGTSYTQCVPRIRLRPSTTNYCVNDISVTREVFRPDPSLGKYRSEHEIFDSALEESFEDTIHHSGSEDTIHHSGSQNSQSAKDEVTHIVRGAIAAPTPAVPAVTAPIVVTHAAPAQADAPRPPVPAAAREVFYGAGAVPLISPPPAPESEHPDDLEITVFLEPHLDIAPTQVYSPQPGVPVEDNEDVAICYNPVAQFRKSATRSHLPIRLPLTEQQTYILSYLV